MNWSFRLAAMSTFLGAAAILALAQLEVPAANADAVRPVAEPEFIKDLDIRQVPMAKLETTMPASRPETESSGLSVRTAVDRAGARYRHGDNLVLTVEVTEDAYVWVFDTGTSGKVHQVFPNRYESDNFVRAANPIVIPHQEADYRIVVSHPRGTELITVIASKDNAPLAQNLIDRKTQAGPFRALRGNADSIAKDLSISLREAHTHWVGHHQVIYID